MCFGRRERGCVGGAVVVSQWNVERIGNDLTKPIFFTHNILPEMFDILLTTRLDYLILSFDKVPN